jgi:hypothetical protein
MTIHDQKIVAHIRSVFKDVVSHQSDENLMRAYGCMKAVYGQRWTKFLDLLTPDGRMWAYGQHYGMTID